MRRVAAILSALLLLDSAVLRSGTLCDALGDTATVPDVSHAHQPHDSAPAPAPSPRSGHEHDSASHCALMASCGLATMATPAAQVSARIHASPRVRVVRQLAPHSVSIAPEPPPPRA